MFNFHRLILLFGLLLSGVAGTAAAESYESETAVFGTRVSLTIRDVPEDTARAASDEVFALFADIHARFYPWRDGELKTMNEQIRAEQFPISLSPMMTELLTLAIDYSERSEELFNPSIGILLNLWGFFKNPPPTQPPPEADIKTWQQNTPSMLAIKIRNQQMLAATRYHQLDFGALGKGYSLDLARDILAKHGIANAFINIGGNISVMGKNGSRAWRVALSNTSDGSTPPLAVVNLYDGESVATSGQSGQFFDYNGTRYHHIMDPRTGYPAVKSHTAIVIASGERSGAVTDAAATALVIADDEESKRIMTRFGVDKVWRINNEDESQTPAMRVRIEESRSL